MSTLGRRAMVVVYAISLVLMWWGWGFFVLAGSGGGQIPLAPGPSTGGIGGVMVGFGFLALGSFFYFVAASTLDGEQKP